MTLALADIVAAHRRIADGIYLSPCPESIPLSEITGVRALCKLDYLQRTGSFKERGARNALMQLAPEQRAAGVVAASAGNHALGLAYHGNLLGIPVTVVMPKFAPLVKITTCRRLGATVILHGDLFAEARNEAGRLAHHRQLSYVHGFDDPAIIAGQGTMGLEILQQVPDVEAIVVPVGGAGLIAGVSLAVKSLRPEVLVVGVEAARAPSFTAALAAGQPVDSPVQPTLADGLAVGRVGQLAFEISRPRVDRVVTVSEEELSLAVLRLVELEKSVVEGAGAAALAAVMAGKLPLLAGKRTVLILSGGNIDPMILSRVIEKGLVADGRLCRFTAVISDRPGGLAHLAQLIAQTGASVKDVAHDRAFSGPDVAAAHVLCTVETADREHIARLYRLLADEGIEIVPAPVNTPAN
ncbi:MAG TPA: threonine ammonia-lyase [Pirellulales bacterium]|nr:threonine ammonia-lyase [Pirellulales bacterium]